MTRENMSLPQVASAVLGALVLSLWIPPVFAEPPKVFVPSIPADRGSEEQFQRSKYASKDAKKAFARRRWKTMLQHTESAWRMYKSPTYALMAGTALAKLKRYDEAFQWLLLAKAMKPNSLLLEQVDAELAKVADQTSRGLLELKVTPNNAKVVVSGTHVDAWLVGVDPGSHVVAVQAEGFLPKTETVTVSKGIQPTVVTIDLEKLPPAKPAKPAKPRPAAPSAGGNGGSDVDQVGDDETMTIAGWSLVGVAGTLVIAGGVVAGLAIDDGETLNPQAPNYGEQFDDAQLRQNIGWGLLGVGVAALATGFVLVALDTSNEPSKTTGGLVPLPDGGVVLMGGTW